MYPRKCFNCGVSLDCAQTNSICLVCLNKISLIKRPFCNICGTPFNFEYEIPDENSYSCGSCRTETHNFNQARSFGKYEGILKEALIHYKYRGRVELLKDLMRLSQDFCGGDCIRPERPDFILHVPLHKKKLAARGFDQAYLIARTMSELSDIPIRTDILFRKKETVPQAGLKKQARENNLKGAFAVKDDISLKNKKVLLVDDVFTTGATVNECSKALKQNGTARVDVFTLARAV